MDEKVRRLVTGYTPSGESSFSGDELVEPQIIPGVGARVFNIWGWNDGPPRLPSAIVPRPIEGLFPGRHGVKVVIAEMLPSSSPKGDERFAGPEQFHQSDTVDIAFVLSGECVAIMSNGEEMLLRAGNVLIQNGTMHKWVNRGRENCVTAFVMVGADRDAV